MFFDELKAFYLFQNIGEEAIQAINGMNIIVKRYKKGEIVNLFDDPIDYFHVIMKGSLKTNEYKLNGKEIVSSYYYAYDAFPFYLVYGGAKKFPYNIYCHKDALIYHVPVKPLMQVIESDSQFMQNALKFVASYCRYNKKVIQTVTFPKVNQRLAFWLLSSSDENDDFILPDTQQIFADMLLVNRSSLNQELKQLEKEGVIEIKGNLLHIIDRQYLDELLEYAI